tara:strand:- start:49 stop:417 length:369 start_codon:yes stop_codon:yes gene_type:complete
MADLKIPKLNKKSDKFFLKKKLSLRTKSKRKLINEFFAMLSIGIFIIFLIFRIPNKLKIFNNFFYNFGELISNFLDSISYFYEIFLAVFIVISLVFALILISGSFSRLIKILKRKSRNITFN